MTIQESNQFLREQADSYNKRKSDMERWAFFGAGSCAQRAIQNGFEPEIIIDNNESRWGRLYLDRFPICGLKEFIQKYGTDYPVLIASAFAPEIGKQLHEEQFSRYYSYLHITREHYGSFAPLEEERTYLREVGNLLADRESKETLDRIIEKRERYEDDYSDIEKPDQYFQEDIYKPRPDEIFIDCGAYDGDTIEKFLKWAGNQYQKIYGFEMDIHNFQRLKAKYEGRDRVIPYNYGVWNEDASLSYAVRSEGAGSILEETGECLTDCVPLDHIIKDKPTLIKMDVEGAELKALEGARQIIKDSRPALAICVYHKAEDLFEIPLWIHQLVPEYKLYLRHHSPNHEETVVYAVL